MFFTGAYVSVWIKKKEKVVKIEKYIKLMEQKVSIREINAIEEKL